eukprot:27754_1
MAQIPNPDNRKSISKQIRSSCASSRQSISISHRISQISHSPSEVPSINYDEMPIPPPAFSGMIQNDISINQEHQLQRKNSVESFGEGRVPNINNNDNEPNKQDINEQKLHISPIIRKPSPMIEQLQKQLLSQNNLNLNPYKNDDYNEDEKKEMINDLVISPIYRNIEPNLDESKFDLAHNNNINNISDAEQDNEEEKLDALQVRGPGYSEGDNEIGINEFDNNNILDRSQIYLQEKNMYLMRCNSTLSDKLNKLKEEIH